MPDPLKQSDGAQKNPLARRNRLNSFCLLFLNFSRAQTFSQRASTNGKSTPRPLPVHRVHKNLHIWSPYDAVEVANSNSFLNLKQYQQQKYLHQRVPQAIHHSRANHQPASPYFSKHPIETPVRELGVVAPLHANAHPKLPPEAVNKFARLNRDVQPVLDRTYRFPLKLDYSSFLKLALQSNQNPF